MITFHKLNLKEDYAHAVAKLQTTDASVVFISDIFRDIVPKIHQVFVVVIDPMVTMCRVLNECCKYHTYECADNSGYGNFIGPGTYICEGTVIGENVHIDGNVFIYGGVKIGNNVTIKAGTVIGGDGYQHSMVDGKLLPWRHLAGVVIEDNVNIGSCVCIDRGLFADTVLQRGCHIDNLCNIAHSVNIGQNASVIANCMIAGSVQIGDRAWIAPSTSVLNGAHIGKDAYVGIGSVVTRPVADNGFVYGVPAKSPLKRNTEV